MKMLNAVLLVLVISLSTNVFANSERDLKDENGESCTIKAARIAKQYFDVADTQRKIGFGISKDDQFEAETFKNITPGSYDQEFISTIKIKLDRSQNAYRPKNDAKVLVKFSGDYDCDNLKVKSIKLLGGVERVE